MAITPHKIQGFQSQFKFQPTGGQTVQFKSLSEFELNIKGDAMDASDHDGGGWKSYMTGMLDWDGSIKGVYVEGDPTQLQILNALLGQEAMQGTFYPQVTAAGTGQLAYQGEFTITGWKHSGKNNDVQGIDITLKCAGPLAPIQQ